MSAPDPARIAVIRDVLNEMGIDVQSDEEVINALDLVRAVFAERRLRDERLKEQEQYERLYYDEWPDEPPT